MSSSATGNSPGVDRGGSRPVIPMILPMLVIFFFLLGFFTVYLFRATFHYVATVWLLPPRFRAGVEAPPRPPPAATGLPPEVLESFPVLAFSAVRRLSGSPGELACAICLSELSDGDAVRLIPACRHAFHPECIDMWLATHSSCPVCRCNLEKQPAGNSQGRLSFAAADEEGGAIVAGGSVDDDADDGGGDCSDGEYTLRPREEDCVDGRRRASPSPAEDSGGRVY